MASTSIGGSSTSTPAGAPRISPDTASYCYLDLDVDSHRSKLGRGAAFVRATNSRYGFSSPDLRLLGGSEVKRIPELIAADHEWKDETVELRAPPPQGNGRVVVELFWDAAPLACQNFATLCSNSSSVRGEASGKPLTYRQCRIHRVVPNFVMQGGDVVFGNGAGGESIYGGGKKFKDERGGLLKKHDRRGVLSMGNSGKNSNTSQWFVTFGPAPQCDGKHVVFGRVVSGFDVLDAVEACGTTMGDGSPTVPIIVTDCGLYQPLHTPGAGYWYDKPDPDAYEGISPIFMVRPRVAVVVPNSGVLDRFQKVLEKHCMVVPVIGEGEDHKPSGASPLSRLVDLLEMFAVDVVLVAPACRDHVPLSKLEPALERWRISADGIKDFDVRRVVVEAKPTDALSAVQSKSWLGTRTAWTLDGTLAS